ncbi:hypothetical protein [Amycolatopsis vastitatis]|uniref:hypothetical protein n=1 Tax=Amycolatopsis vastitatis TaxID=1905142 RepID=UPI001178339B|nr:hypothetical protein [Amycolatopsis vastitatis]
MASATHVIMPIGRRHELLIRSSRRPNLWERDIGIFPVDFESQGDRWAHYVAIELTGDGYMAARGTDGTSPVELGPPPSAALASRLRVHPNDNGIACSAVGDAAEASDDQVEPWRQAAEAAVLALAKRELSFTWQAIVGTAPYTLGIDRVGQLKAPCSLGHVYLEPGSVCMREAVLLDDRIDSGPGVRHSFPVVVTGAVESHAWEAAYPFAEWSLGRTCALLSLATGRLWVPRSQPRQLHDEQERLRVPAIVGAPIELPGFVEKPEWRGQIPPDTAQFDLPEWMPHAWRILKADPGLATAVHAHYEAMRLDHHHSSIAYLTYVAAIEGFGKRFVDDAPCDCQPDCPHPKGVAQKRFRKALKTVLSNRDVKKFAETAYQIRSSTGHEGSLFGSEQTFGRPPFSLFQPVSDFGISWLGEMRRVSQRVLATALANASRTGQHPSG